MHLYCSIISLFLSVPSLYSYLFLYLIVQCLSDDGVDKRRSSSKVLLQNEVSFLLCHISLSLHFAAPLFIYSSIYLFICLSICLSYMFTSWHLLKPLSWCTMGALRNADGLSTARLFRCQFLFTPIVVLLYSLLFLPRSLYISLLLCIVISAVI